MVSLFTCFALPAISILILRRRFAGGELGGVTWVKIGSSIVLISFWIIFVLLNAFQDYGYFNKAF